MEQSLNQELSIGVIVDNEINVLDEAKLIK